MNKKGFAAIYVVLAVLVFVAALGGYFYINNSQNKANNYVEITDSGTDEVITETKNEIQSGWKTYTSSDYGFTFKYPAEASLNDTGSNYMAVSFMGQKQIDSGRIQTELFDGYAFNVVDLSTEGQFANLQEFADSRMALFDDVCQMVSEPEEGSINNNKYISVQADCLGNFTIYYFENNGRFLEVGLLVTGDEEDTPRYAEIVENILSTFDFTKN